MPLVAGRSDRLAAFAAVAAPATKTRVKPSNRHMNVTSGLSPTFNSLAGRLRNSINKLLTRP